MHPIGGQRSIVAVLLFAGLVLAGAQPSGAAEPKSPGPNQGGSTASLSGELSRSRGVIHPPPTGDGGVIRPPQAGKEHMPVIRPPGSPGGNQRVEPK